MIPIRLDRLSGQIPVRIIDIGESGILRQLIAGVVLAAVVQPVAHGIIAEGLRKGQRMRGRREPVEIVIAERLGPAPIGETCAIAHVVVHIVCFIDLSRTGRDLVENVRHLARGIVRIRRLRAVR